MQAKGLIKFFTIVLVLVCLYQLSFTLATRYAEGKADDYANQIVPMSAPAGLSGAALISYEDSVNDLRKQYRRAYLDSIGDQTLINIGLIKYSYKDCRDKQISLGLDLKGGMSLVLEIAEDDVLRKLAYNSKSETFNKAIAKAIEKQKNDQRDFLSIFAQTFKETDPNAKLSAIFAPIEAYQGKITFSSSNDEVIAVVRKDMDAAVRNTFNVLKTRIDQFGVAAANISLQENSGRIVIELPGVDDPTRVRRILQQTAQLEFWETYENEEVINFLSEANDVLRARKLAAGSKAEASVTDTVEVAQENLTDTLLIAGTDSSLLNTLSDSSTAEAAAKDTAANKNINPLFDVLAPNLYTTQQNQTAVAEGPVVGIVAGKDTAKVNRYLALPEVKAVFPRDLKLLWSAKPMRKDANFFALYAIKQNPASPEAPLTGDVIVDAFQSYDQYGIPEVDLNMNSMGAAKWERLTEAAYNSEVSGRKINRCVAIVLDNRVFSAPRVQAVIKGGRSQITGIEEIDEATDLANILKSGKLEARTKVIEEQIIGPSLGKESIQSGLMSLAIGLLVTVLFMIAYYSGSGVIANLALLLNLLLIIGTVASIPGASLTLPGMAGIVLTLAMAVDANVIINERIREEIRRGKGLRLAIQDGYRHSYSAVIDGNLTTLLIGFILLFFGLGPVKGFAVVLVIGLFSSMFTAILSSRMIFDWWLDKGKQVSFGNDFTMNLFQNINFAFIEKRKLSYAFSAIIFGVCLVSMFTLGFDLGVDFKGGRSYVVKFDKNVTTQEVAQALSSSLDGTPIVKTYGSTNQVSITTAYLVDSKETNADSIIEQKIFEGVSQFFQDKPDFEAFRTKHVKSSIKIEASVADDIRTSAWWAGILGILGVFLYILFRFKRWQYATGAIIALVHDPVLVLGTFSLCKTFMPFSLEIDQTIVAAILTLIGYSINDTVVVFDRIREFVALHPTRPLIQNVNDSINTTLSRTINTSLVTLLVVIVLFLFGGEAIRGFSFALILGIVIGTYSSIFVAAPVMVDLVLRDKKA